MFLAYMAESRKEKEMKKVWELFVKPPEGVEETSEDKRAPAPVPLPRMATAPVVVSSLARAAAVSATAPQVVDSDMMARLKTAMLSDGNNAVDRFEAVFASLAGIVPDANDMRFLAAIKSAASQGLKPDDVLVDVLSDERILTQKEGEFAQVVARERENALGGKQKQMEAAAAEIAKKQAEILAAQKEIQRLEAGQTVLQEQAAEEARKIADVEGRFKATLDALRGARTALEQKLRPHCTQKGQ